MNGPVVRAVRGATSVEEDTPEAILESTAELLHEVIERNDLSTDDLISMIFTMTPDLRSEFPALAARQAGVAPEEVFYTDDIPKNVEGARAAGFDAVLFTTAAQYAADLRARGVRFNY